MQALKQKAPFLFMIRNTMQESRSVRENGRKMEVGAFQHAVFTAKKIFRNLSERKIFLKNGFCLNFAVLYNVRI